MSELSQDQKKDIAQESDIDRNKIADLNDLGEHRGRDDYAGGDNDEMRGPDSNQATDT